MVLVVQRVIYVLVVWDYFYDLILVVLVQVLVIQVLLVFILIERFPIVRRHKEIMRVVLRLGRLEFIVLLVTEVGEV